MRRCFMHNQLETVKTKHACEHSARKNHVRYYLKDSSGTRQNVCKMFFLATLGYPRKSSVIHEMLKRAPAGSVTAPLDARGGLREARTSDKDINAHIESYHPALPHYRRAHAPNRRYLSSELTIAEMHADYQTKYPAQTISYRTYQRVMKELNISFAKLVVKSVKSALNWKTNMTSMTRKYT